MKKRTRIIIPKKYSVFRDGRRYVPFDAEIANGCAGKLQFKNLSAAENHILRQFPEDFTMLPYRCSRCRRYHIGHKKSKNKK